ncbi:hypothetical protein [Streptomyces sp. NPDC047972]|uniref:hypothetical protein n=1 Tax=Streptomyces sp. NPDC047972 TaxID=3365493 RepID=UPI00371F245F
MDISDEGRELDARWRDADDNVHGVLHGCRDASTVAARFAAAGWRSRSSSWHGYALETAWCLLEIDPVEGPDVLLSGVVDPTRLDDLARLLDFFGLRYELELRDEENTLVRELTG